MSHKIIKGCLIVFYLFGAFFLIMLGKTMYEEYFTEEKTEYKFSSDYEMTESRNENVFEPYAVEEKKSFQSNKGITEKNIIEKTIDNISELLTPNSTSDDSIDYSPTLTPQQIKKIKEQEENNTKPDLKCSIDKYTNIINNNGLNRIHYISVGPGDATLVESNGHFGLIDSTNPSYQDGTPQAIISSSQHTVDHVISYIKSVTGCSGSNCKGKLEFIIGTHAHSDHIGGMVKIANTFANENTTYFYRTYVKTRNDFFQNGYYNSTKPDKAYDRDNDWDNLGYYKRTIEAMKANNACLEDVTGKKPDFTFGDFNIKILNTETFNYDEATCMKDGSALASSGKLTKSECEKKGGKLYASDDNKNAIIQLITYKNSKTLLAADMEKEDELRLIQDSNTKELLSNIDVLKFAHHGNITSSRMEFIKVAKAKHGVISRYRISPSKNIIFQMRYMVNNYNSKVYLLGMVKDAIVQTYSSDGKYTLTNYDNKTSINEAQLNLTPVKSSGNWHKYSFLDNNNQANIQWYYFDDEEAIKTTGWLKYRNQWYYINLNGSAATGWQYLDYNGKSSWYHFDQDGIMQKGWIKTGESWYYLGAGGAMVTGWKKIDYNGKSSWYYFNQDGTMQKGWIKLDGSWYYLGTGGAMVTDWQYLDYNGKSSWYYFNQDGIMQKGWIKSGGNWYYLGAGGAMVTGWQKINWKDKDSWFYFETSGKMISNQCKTIDSDEFCFDSSGVCYNGKGC